MIAALPRLLAVTDDRVLTEGRVAERAAEMARAGGPRFAVGLRNTVLTDRELLALATRLNAVLKAHNSHLGISGRADIARAAGADMILAGHGSLSVRDLKRVAANAIVIASIHDADELRGASAADAFIAGPVFEKQDAKTQGRMVVSMAAASGKPVYAIGGVTPARVGEVLEAGAWGVAAIRALWDADDPAAAVTEFLAAMPVDESVSVMINGQRKSARRGVSLEQLLADLQLDPRAVVVEHNREIVRREQLAGKTIADGDTLELVHFVGGG